MNDPYITLGIHPDAAPQVMRAAYMGLCQANHPDKGGSADKMAALTEAWAAIKDVKAKRLTDNELKLCKKLERPACPKCKGRGLHVLSKGFHSGPEVVCPVCKGTGLPR